MSERERWIVYPLLFLALGAALRDKLFDRTTSKSIVCQELTVVDAAPVGNRSRILARIGSADPHSGQAATGHLFVNGQVEVQGVINARHYYYQGMQFVPALPVLPSGVSWPEVLRAAQQAAQMRQQQSAAETPQAEPPPAQPEQTPAQPAQPEEEAPKTERLVEPAENQ